MASKALPNLEHEGVKCPSAINLLSAEGPRDNWLVAETIDLIDYVTQTATIVYPVCTYIWLPYQMV